MYIDTNNKTTNNTKLCKKWDSPRSENCLVGNKHDCFI